MNVLRQLGISLLIVLGLMANIGFGMVAEYSPAVEKSAVNDISHYYSSQLSDCVTFIQNASAANPHTFNYRTITPDWCSVDLEAFSNHIQPLRINAFPDKEISYGDEYFKLLYPFHEFS